MRTPAPNRPITSGFGPRVHPVTGKQSFHYGLDFGGSFPVQAAGDGVVEKVGYSRTGYGHYVIVRNSETVRTLYAHGAHKTHYVEGQFIKEGAIIYQSGSTGLSTGNHLHFEVRVRKNLIWHRVDPLPYITSTPEVDEEDEEDDMDLKPFVVFRKEGPQEWSLVAPWLAGEDEKQSGYVVTINLNRAVAWQRMYMKGAGSAHSVDRAGYIAIQEEARFVREQWLAAQGDSGTLPPELTPPKTYIGTLELKEQ